METLRTPDDRFQRLPGYDFSPHHLEVDDGEACATALLRFIAEHPA